MKRIAMSALMCMVAAMVALAGCAPAVASPSASAQGGSTQGASAEATEDAGEAPGASASAEGSPSVEPTLALAEETIDVNVAQTGSNEKILAAQEGGQVVVGLSLPNLRDTIYEQVATGIQAQCEELGYKLVTKDAMNDADRQAKDFEEFLEEGVTAVIASPISQAALEEPTRAMNEAGIILVSFGVQLPNANQVFAIDDYTLGEQLGANAAAFSTAVHSGIANILILTDDSKDRIATRADGMQEAVLQGTEDPVIVDRVQQTTKEGARSATEQALERQPELNVILATSDEAAVGALEAIQDAHLSEEQQATIFIGSIGGAQDALDRVSENGMYRATVGIISDTAGRNCVQAIQGIIESGRMPVRSQVATSYWFPALTAQPTSILAATASPAPSGQAESAQPSAAAVDPAVAEEAVQEG